MAKQESKNNGRKLVPENNVFLTAILKWELQREHQLLVVLDQKEALKNNGFLTVEERRLTVGTPMTSDNGCFKWPENSITE